MGKVFPNRKKGFFEEHWIALIILWLLFFERLYMMSRLGADYGLKSDDASYVKAGITFFHTGAITMHGVVSAQIMPGLPVLIGAFVALFGEGYGMWIGLKFFWCLLGTLAPWFVYLTIDSKAPKWAAILPMLLFFTPDFAWQENLILTETPFLFLTCLYLYGLFRLGDRKDWPSYFIVFGAAFLAFMLKAQAAVYFFLPVPYLWMKKYPSTKLYGQCFLTLLLVSCFIVPWTVRNYYHFGELIPTTYGIGNPLLLGTYQGVGYPKDEDAFKELAIRRAVEEEYQNLKEKDGTYSAKHKRFIALRTDEAKAHARMGYWWRHDRVSMLKSYLYIKPKSMLYQTFYWDEVVPHTKGAIEWGRHVDFFFALAALPAAILARRTVAEVIFLLFAYGLQVYMYAYAYVFDRYAQSLLPFRYIAVGFFLAAAAEILKKSGWTIESRWAIYKTEREFNRQRKKAQ